MSKREKKPRCRGKTKAGKRCTRRATNGTRCKLHPPRKRGRKLIVWDEDTWRMFDAMCSCGALERDIAEAIRVDVDTLSAICKRDRGGLNFSEYRALKKSKGRVSLAAKQLEVAMTGQVAMLIWLGKQWLEQREPKQDHGHEHSGPGGGPIRHTTRDLSKWTDEELEHAERLAEKLADEDGD